MTYNSLFTVLTDESLVDETLDHAMATATEHDAHLDVLCLGVDRSQSGYYYAGASAIVLQETIARAQEEAEAIEVRARKVLGGTALRWAVESASASWPIWGGMSRPAHGSPTWLFCRSPMARDAAPSLSR